MRNVDQDVGGSSIAGAEQKDLTTPDETRTFEKGRVDLLDMRGDAAAGWPAALLAETEAAANAV